jgi:hypothetical protein
MKKMDLFDDGQKTYAALNEVDWNGKIAETPFGDAAYTGSGEPPKMATARIGGWHGNANGRTWSCPYPTRVKTNPTDVPFDINAEDIVAVDKRLGGGFVEFGRHDLHIKPEICTFGKIHTVRISNSEAMPEYTGKLAGDGSFLIFDQCRNWMDEYAGDRNFELQTETKIGTREQLKIAGMKLTKFGWFVGDQSLYEIIEEKFIDNLGDFAIRQIPIKRVEYVPELTWRKLDNDKMITEAREEMERFFIARKTKNAKIADEIFRLRQFDLTKPATDEKLKTVLRDIAGQTWERGLSLGDWKREFLAGLHAYIAEKYISDDEWMHNRLKNAV